MTRQSTSSSDADKVELSVRLDAELMDQVSRLTNDPSKVIEVALKQWLRSGRRAEDTRSRPLNMNPPVPPKGEWND
ncbi:MAG: hypothetical protein F6J97_05695 [Leptolyngbya sp. SIO4C1]|nr:hypothetical protein [Leptolyngbya sp. SIO4C1]